MVSTTRGRSAVGTSEQSPGEALESLATLIHEVLMDTEARKQFFADPKSTLGKLRLPDEVATFFSELSYEELRLLGKTCETMERANLAQDIGDRGRVCFL
jgi:hypothetical protein